MINGGDPFTLRVIRDGGGVAIQSGAGEAWWLLQNPTEDVLAASSARIHGMEGLEHFWALIKILAKIGRPIERCNLKLDAVGELAEMNDNFIDEVFDGYRGFRFWRHIDANQYYIVVRTIDPTQKGESGVSIEASIVRQNNLN